MSLMPANAAGYPSVPSEHQEEANTEFAVCAHVLEPSRGVLGLEQPMGLVSLCAMHARIPGSVVLNPFVFCR